MQNIVLQNERVLLRQVELADREAIYQAAQDERIWTHMSIDLQTTEAVASYVEQAIKERENGTSYVFVIINQHTQQIVGCTSFLDIAPTHKRLEIGATWLSPAVWQTAINTNCKFLLLSYCFEELGYQRVQIKTGHENVRSQQAIERIGAVKEGVLRNHMIKKEGIIRHTVMYSIVKGEWEEVKIRFTQCLLRQ